MLSPQRRRTLAIYQDLHSDLVQVIKAKLAFCPYAGCFLSLSQTLPLATYHRSLSSPVLVPLALTDRSSPVLLAGEEPRPPISMRGDTLYVDVRIRT